MVDLKANTITQGDLTEQILRFTVVFMTPFGWASNLSEAVTKCESVDLDPRTCVILVPMAVSDRLSEVMR